MAFFWYSIGIPFDQLGLWLEFNPLLANDYNTYGVIVLNLGEISWLLESS